MLARYACDPARTQGRRIAEPASPPRTEYQRDRDRIVGGAEPGHSQAVGNRIDRELNCVLAPGETLFLDCADQFVVDDEARGQDEKKIV